MVRGTIALLSDFGTRGGCVGATKGVLPTQAPHAEVVDIAHDSPAGDVLRAAGVPATAWHDFPEGTVVLCVVDPGAPLWPHAGVNPVFHGRDLFAPAAATLARGVRLGNVGEPIGDFTSLPLTKPVHREDESIKGHIIHIDRFRNRITTYAPGCSRVGPPSSRSEPTGRRGSSVTTRRDRPTSSRHYPTARTTWSSASGTRRRAFDSVSAAGMPSSCDSADR